MKINLGNWLFYPRLITSVFAVIFFILFLCLGFWQLDRAEQKRELQLFFNEKQEKEIGKRKRNEKREKGKRIEKKKTRRG